MFGVAGVTRNERCRLASTSGRRILVLPATPDPVRKDGVRYSQPACLVISQ